MARGLRPHVSATRLQERLNASGPCSDPSPATPVRSTATTQTISGLTNGTTYTFKVAAKNAVGTGAQSEASNPVTPTELIVKAGVGSVTEGDSGQVVVEVPVSLSPASPVPVSVTYATIAPTGSGLATAGVDFVPVSGTLTFAPGETEKLVPVTVNGDREYEVPAFYGEWAMVQLSDPTAGATIDTGGLYGLGIAVIVDDDPIPTITAGVGAIAEGDDGLVELQVPVTLSNPASIPVGVDYATLAPTGPGLATADVDFVPVSGTLAFAPGQTEAFVTVMVHGDDLHEDPALYGEWLLVQLANPTAGATIDTGGLWGLGIGVIIDDD